MSQDLNGLAMKLEAMGVTPPDPMVNALAVWVAVNQVSTDDVLADLAQRVADCNIDKKEAVKSVKAAAVALAQRDWGTQVARNLSGSFVRAQKLVIHHNADEIVTRMRVPFDESVATITEAIAVVGPDPEAAAVRGAGPVVHAQYDRWESAMQCLAKIEQVLARMVPMGYGRDGQRVTWFLAEAFDQDAIDTAQNVWQAPGNGFTHLIHAGYQLHLNTAAEATALATAAQAVSQEAADADAEAARAAAKAEGEAYMRPYQDYIDQHVKPKDEAA